MSRRTAALLVLTGGLLIPAACSNRTPSYPERQAPAGVLDSPAAIASGHQLFDAHCSMCHGALEEGRLPNAGHFVPVPPTFLSPRYQRLDPAYLFWRISKGKTVEPYLSEGSVMPAWGAYFSDRQIWDLVAYLRHRGRAGN
jgi:mono/diheme cytochrome c family protein